MKENEIIQKIERLRSRLATTGAVLKGSVSLVRLGPMKTAKGQRVAYMLTYKGPANQTKSITIRKDRIPAVQRMILHYKRAKQTLEDLVALNETLFKTQRK
jgi:hypothetical protein